MRILQTKVYKFDELSEEAKEKAREWIRETNNQDSYPLDEMMGSLKALFEAAHLAIRDYSIGGYNRDNYVKFDMVETTKELTGKRAIAWLENNLISGLRITPSQFKAKQKAYMSYGDAYRIGKVKPCPLTGVCYDEDLLEALQKAVKDGETLNDAVKSLADVVGNMAKKEYEYQNEDEQIDETIRSNDYEFTVDGKVA